MARDRKQPEGEIYKLTRNGKSAAQAEFDGWLRLSSAVTPCCERSNREPEMALASACLCAA